MAKVTAVVETITPERALNLLAKADAYFSKNGKRQRSLKPQKIKDYARDIASGAWQLNGETVIIDKHGIPTNGQHRLRGCVQAQKPFETVVVYGVDPVVFRTIDTGAVRSMGDILTISGRKDANNLAAALSLLAKIENNRGRITNWSTDSNRPSKAELLDLLEKHPKLQQFVDSAHNKGIRVMLSPGLAGVLRYLMDKKDSKQATEFWEALMTGENLKRGDTIYMLRERLIRERQQKPRPLNEQTADIIVRAWNAIRKGEKITKLQRGRVDAEMDLVIR